MSATTPEARAGLRRLLAERERLRGLRATLPAGPAQSEACRAATQAFCQASDAALRTLPALLDDADELDAARARGRELEAGRADAAAERARIAAWLRLLVFEQEGYSGAEVLEWVAAMERGAHLAEGPIQERDGPLDAEEIARIDAAWERHKAAGPAAATGTGGAGGDDAA